MKYRSFLILCGHFSRHCATHTYFSLLSLMSDDVNVIQELIGPPCTCHMQSRHTESTDKLSKLGNKKNRRQTKYYDLLIAAFVGLKSQKSRDSRHWGHRLQESWAIAKLTAWCALYMGALKIFRSPWQRPRLYFSRIFNGLLFRLSP